MINQREAKKIAENFLSRMNPENWDGVGEKPESFDTRIVTYDIDSYDVELDISFEYDEDEKCWLHYCEVRDKASGDMVEPLHGYGVDSVQNLTDTILDICHVA